MSHVWLHIQLRSSFLDKEHNQKERSFQAQQRAPPRVCENGPDYIQAQI